MLQCRRERLDADRTPLVAPASEPPDLPVTDPQVLTDLREHAEVPTLRRRYDADVHSRLQGARRRLIWRVESYRHAGRVYVCGLYLLILDILV